MMKSYNTKISSASKVRWSEPGSLLFSGPHATWRPVIALHPEEALSSNELRATDAYILRIYPNLIYLLPVGRVGESHETKAEEELELERKKRRMSRHAYLDPWKSSVQVEPLLPFSLAMKDADVPSELKELLLVAVVEDLEDEDHTSQKSEQVEMLLPPLYLLGLPLVSPSVVVFVSLLFDG
ncbi:hypothetical protein YC2023_053828 [Brassica napus]